MQDPNGRRIAKLVNGTVVEKYLWSGLTTLLAVYDGFDNLLQRFEYADGRMPVAMTSGGSTYYLAYDQVGSLRLVTDSSGAVVKWIDYDTFGNILDETNAGFTVSFGFAGGLHDRDTGLVRFGFRDYMPEIGRWTAKDPILFAAGDSNLYGYVGNDPVNYLDPYGLYTEIIVWQPVGWRSSSFGHVSSNLNGANYSWGPSGWDTRYLKASDYADRQKTFRSGVGAILDLTPDQERRLQACYNRSRDDYDAMSNNCADPHQECLSDVLGTTLTNALFPVNFGELLLDSSHYKGTVIYEPVD